MGEPRLVSRLVARFPSDSVCVFPWMGFSLPAALARAICTAEASAVIELIAWLSRFGRWVVVQMTQEEADLIQRAKQRDPVALAEIYKRHQPAIYRYVLHRVTDITTAEDLTSEVFVRLMKKIDSFSYRGRPILAWLYTIARNLVADHHRRAGRLPELPLDERSLEDAAGAENHIQNWLTQHRLLESLSGLTAEQYEVILLRFVEGLDNDTVAEILGKSVRAVKSLQYRGLVALRQTLEPNGW